MQNEQTVSVVRPDYYKRGEVQVVDVVEAWGLDFCLGNVIKYVCRAGKKGEATNDLLKAQWYLERAIEKSQTA